VFFAGTHVAWLRSTDISGPSVYSVNHVVMMEMYIVKLIIEAVVLYMYRLLPCVAELFSILQKQLNW